MRYVKSNYSAYTSQAKTDDISRPTNIKDLIKRNKIEEKKDKLIKIITCRIRSKNDDNLNKLSLHYRNILFNKDIHFHYRHEILRSDNYHILLNLDYIKLLSSKNKVPRRAG